MSLTAVLSQEAREEVKRTLHSRNMHVGVDGRMNFSSNDDIISLVLASMTS